VVRDPALGALNGEAKWEKSIQELMEAWKRTYRSPVREVGQAVRRCRSEDILFDFGRGTVVTGRGGTRQGGSGEEVEIVGFRPTMKRVVTGIEMFRKLLDEGLAGDNDGVCCCGNGEGRKWSGASVVQTGVDHAAHEVQGGSVRLTKEKGVDTRRSSRGTDRSFTSDDGLKEM